MSEWLAGLDWSVLQATWAAHWPVVTVAAAVASLVVMDRLATRWRIGAVARRLGAKVTRERGQVLPTLEWRDGGRLARLAFPPGDGASLHSTLCRVAFPQPVRFRVEIRRRSLLGRLALWLPARRGEVRTGQRAFDRLFVILGADPGATRRWLDRSIRRTLVQLARCAGGSGLVLACDGEALVARLAGAVTARSDLRLFAETAVWLSRTVEAAAWDSAVAFAPAERGSTSIAGPLCPACAEPTGLDEFAGCPACTARHHPACWDWLGGCGVFGCAGGARVSARAA